jgi:cyclophilin family peptidyl-prolyl cis-trans isomerase
MKRIVRALPAVGAGLASLGLASRAYDRMMRPAPGLGRDTNPVVFLRLEAVRCSTSSVERRPLGTVAVELRSDVAPRTAENFRALCTHEHGFGYRQSRVHRVRPGLLQGGDIEYEDGFGGRSIYGRTFADESFALPHRRGTLTMANQGSPDTNGSQFVLLTEDAPWLDGEHVAFGHVVEGIEVLEAAVQGYPTPQRVRDAGAEGGQSAASGAVGDSGGGADGGFIVRIVDCGELDSVPMPASAELAAAT